MWELVNQPKWIIMNHGSYPVCSRYITEETIPRQHPRKSSCSKLCETIVLDGLDESPGGIHSFINFTQKWSYQDISVFCRLRWWSIKSLLLLTLCLAFIFIQEMHSRWHALITWPKSLLASLLKTTSLWSSVLYIASLLADKYLEGHHTLVVWSSLIPLIVIIMSEFSTTKEPWSWINASNSGLYAHCCLASCPLTVTNRYVVKRTKSKRQLASLRCLCCCLC